MRPRLLIGTGNPGKLAEFRRILAGLEYDLVAPGDLSPAPVEPEEAGDTFVDNAIAKGRAYAAATGLLTVADDSGLEVDALGGAPGTRSRRYFGEHARAEERNAKLLALLEREEHRAARFVCAIALVPPVGEPELFMGEVRGEIARAPRSLPGRGFGYDPIFVVAGGGRTMAELPVDEKDRISHRGVAGAKLRARLAEPRH